MCTRKLFDSVEAKTAYRAGGGRNHKLEPKNCCGGETTCGETSPACEESSRNARRGSTTEVRGAECFSRPSAGEKCCNSEAPTVARLLAEWRTFKPFVELGAAR